MVEKKQLNEVPDKLDEIKETLKQIENLAGELEANFHSHFRWFVGAVVVLGLVLLIMLIVLVRDHWLLSNIVAFKGETVIVGEVTAERDGVFDVKGHDLRTNRDDVFRVADISTRELRRVSVDLCSLWLPYEKYRFALAPPGGFGPYLALLGMVSPHMSTPGNCKATVSNPAVLETAGKTSDIAIGSRLFIEGRWRAGERILEAQRVYHVQGIFGA